MKLFLKAMLVLMIGIFTVSLNAMEREPAGENLLNLAYFSTRADEIYTHTPLVLEEGTHTFQYDYGFIHEVEIRLDGVSIVNGSNPPKECTTSGISNNNICTFESHEDAEIEIFLKGDQLERAFGMNGIFMLSKNDGEIPYEPFIPLEIESDPEFSGEATYFVSYDSAIDPHDLIGSHITAYDEIDGDLTNDITIISDEYSISSNQTGRYSVIYEVKDSSKNSAIFELTVDVLDQNPPIIEGPRSFSYTHDQSKTIESIIENNLSFYDGHDGEIFEYFIVSDDYTHNKNTVGTYDVTFEVYDAAGNKTEYTISIDVVDNTSPIITGYSKITMNLSDPFESIDVILDFYQIGDDYTQEENLTFKIFEDTTLGDLTNKGSYDITLRLEDCSNNITDKVIELIIIDDIAPILELPTQHISISYKDTFDLDNYRQQIYVSDNSSELDLDDIYIDVNEYEIREPNELGTYLVIFKVDDLSGNTQEARLIIETYDDVSPVFLVENEIIMQSGLTLNENQLFEHLMLNEDVKAFDPMSMVVIDNEYSGNETTEGTYELTVELSNKAGETMPVSTLITVNEIKEESSQFNMFWWGFSIVPISIIGIYIIKKRK